MPLVKTVIKAEIQAASARLNAGDQTKKTQAENEAAFADAMADVIINAIKSLTLTIPPATIITVGSPTTQTQSVPGIVNQGVS
jgi:hypothetical protein